MPESYIVPGILPPVEWVQRWRRFLTKLEDMNAEDIEAINLLCDLAVAGVRSREANDRPSRRLAAEEMMRLANSMMEAAKYLQ